MREKLERGQTPSETDSELADEDFVSVGQAYLPTVNKELHSVTCLPKEAFLLLFHVQAPYSLPMPCHFAAVNNLFSFLHLDT